MAIFGVIIAVIVWLGLYPQPVLRTAQPTVDSLVSSATYVVQPPSTGDKESQPRAAVLQESGDRTPEMKYDTR
jgi:hypothetical protein